MTSFDIDSQFINIPLEETIKICFESCIELATLDSFSILDEKYYEQKDSVAIGPHCVQLCHFEEQWMSDCLIDCKLVSHKRYVDDTFLLFWSELNVTKFLNYMNSNHQNIKQYALFS